jgi:hypothetical protein
LSEIDRQLIAETSIVPSSGSLSDKFFGFDLSRMPFRPSYQRVALESCSALAANTPQKTDFAR